LFLNPHCSSISPLNSKLLHCSFKFFLGKLQFMTINAFGFWPLHFDNWLMVWVHSIVDAHCTFYHFQIDNNKKLLMRLPTCIEPRRQGRSQCTLHNHKNQAIDSKVVKVKFFPKSLPIFIFVAYFEFRNQNCCVTKLKSWGPFNTKCTHAKNEAKYVLIWPFIC